MRSYEKEQCRTLFNHLLFAIIYDLGGVERIDSKITSFVSARKTLFSRKAEDRYMISRLRNRRNGV